MDPRSPYLLCVLLLTTGCRGGELFTDVPECTWDFVYGCNDGGTWTPTVGNLTHLNVTTETAGSEGDVDPDGYRLRVLRADSLERESLVEVNDLVSLRFVPSTDPEGDRRVELAEVSDNCSVTSENPQTVVIAYDSAQVLSRDVLFTIECSGGI